ncbi:hypothetical protein L3Q82_026747, partial [Scortum barcoo]
RSVRCFANNKPWITSDIKGLLNQKKKAFKDGDTQEIKQIQEGTQSPGLITPLNTAAPTLLLPQAITSKEGDTSPPPLTPPTTTITAAQVCGGLWRAEAEEAAAPAKLQVQMEYRRPTTEGLREGAGTPPSAHIQPELGTGQGRVPQLWKTSCIIPVPKKPHP